MPCREEWMKFWQTNTGSIIYQASRGRCNVYAIAANNKISLIDSGVVSQLKTLSKVFKKIGNPDYLIQTHTHFDHTINTAKLKKQYNFQLLVHEYEAANMREGISPKPIGSVAATRFILKLANLLPGPLGPFTNTEPDIIINEPAYQLENLTILHTPGHSRGSVSIIVDDAIALVGDTLFGIFPNLIFPPFAEDTVQLGKSWKRLLETKCDLFLPGHGRPIKRALLEKCYIKRYD